MDCHRAQDAILDSLVEPVEAELQELVAAHIAGCRSCAAFAQVQRSLDRQLTATLVPPALSTGFRAELRTRVRKEVRTFWWDLLPDAVHFASFGLVGVVALVWLPLSAPVVLALAAGGALLTHVVLTAAHDSLDAAEESAL